MSILPVDQDIEHTAGASFAPNPVYFDPENIVKLAIEGGCNAVASTFGNLGAVDRKYAHKIPFIVKLNHNELLTYPNTYDQVLFGSVDEAWNMGAVAVGATIYFGSEQSRRQLVEISEAFERAHELGMATILWCYLRNGSFKKDGADYHASADLTGQADHLGVTIKADLVKQKLPTNNGGFTALHFGKTNEKINISEVIKSNAVLKEQIGFNHKLFSKANNFKCYEQKQYVLHKLSKPVIPDTTFTRLENVLLKPVNIKKTAKLNLHEFIAPEKNKVVLSKAEISKIKIGAFVPPEKPKLDFAVNAKPETVIKPFEKTEFTLKAFPEVQKINVNMSTFQQPERNKPNISVNVINFPMVTLLNIVGVIFKIQIVV